MPAITISQEAYDALMEAAEARGISPSAVIELGVAVLDPMPTTAEPMTPEEFAAALGRTPEDIAAADAEARRQHPEAFQ